MISNGECLNSHLSNFSIKVSILKEYQNDTLDMNTYNISFFSLKTYLEEVTSTGELLLKRRYIERFN